MTRLDKGKSASSQLNEWGQPGMYEQHGNRRNNAGTRTGLGSVRQAFGRFTRGLDRQSETWQPTQRELNPAVTEAPLQDQLNQLLAVDNFNVSGAARRQLDHRFAAASGRSEEVTSAAFDWDVPEALDDAHRSLYSLYADRVWRTPAAPRPQWAQVELGRIRDNLETGFRHSLARKRQFSPVGPHDGSAEVANWFKTLAFGEHPHDSEAWGAFARDQVSLEQLKAVVAQRSLFFLREPDPWVYAIPSLSGVAKAGLLDLLLDEYGWGKLERMHSSIYAVLLDALGMDFTVDHYESAASWQYLATLNHQWMCALTPEHRRRLLGTIYLTEATSPDAMSNYLAAWERLGITDPRVTEFYELHVTADENHRDVALFEVLLPVCEADPKAAAEIALGIFDARTLEAQFADHLIEQFTADREGIR